ncbi:UNVERIFIED_ORG: hypothetical protein FHR35_005313 [Microbispora rosea subsp. rosea]
MPRPGSAVSPVPGSAYARAIARSRAGVASREGKGRSGQSDRRAGVMASRCRAAFAPSRANRVRYGSRSGSNVPG